MEKFIPLNLCHLIIRPSIKDEEKFKGFVPFIINWIFEKKSISFYSISEELGDPLSPGYHLDILIFAKAQIDKNIINNKAKQIGLAGHCRTFMDQNLPSSNWNIFFKNVKENLEKDHEYNIQFLIGYNMKEQGGTLDLKNWNNLQLTEEIIDTCVKFYDENKSEKPQKTKRDVIPLNNKNAMYEMKKYLSNIENPEYHNLISDTIMKDYCWIGMAKKSTRKLILQLKLIGGHADDHEIAELNDDTLRDLNPVLDQMEYIRFQPSYIRLQYLFENGLLKKDEYDALCKP